MLNVKPKDGTLTEVLGFQHMLMITIKPATPTGQAISYGFFGYEGVGLSRGWVINSPTVSKELSLCSSLIFTKLVFIHFERNLYRVEGTVPW